jgi:hypothetical protein
MVAVPAATPPTVPAATVAIAVLPLVHTPPATPSLRLVVNPVQTLAVPLMAAGEAFTVTTVVTEHPAPRE